MFNKANKKLRYQLSEIMIYPRHNTIHGADIEIGDIIDNYWDLRSVVNWMNIIDSSHIDFNRKLMNELHMLTHIHKGLLTQYFTDAEWNIDKRIRMGEIGEFKKKLKCCHRYADKEKAYRLLENDNTIAKCDICGAVFEARVPTIDDADEAVAKFHSIYQQLLSYIGNEMKFRGFDELIEAFDDIDYRMDELLFRYEKCFKIK